MDIKEHNLIMISDENGGDVVGNFLNQLYVKSKESQDAKMHLIFLNSAFNLLSVQPLENLITNRNNDHSKRKTKNKVLSSGETAKDRSNL